MLHLNQNEKEMLHRPIRAKPRGKTAEHICLSRTWRSIKGIKQINKTGLLLSVGEGEGKREREKEKEGSIERNEWQIERKK